MDENDDIFENTGVQFERLSDSEIMLSGYGPRQLIIPHIIGICVMLVVSCFFTLGCILILQGKLQTDIQSTGLCFTIMSIGWLAVFFAVSSLLQLILPRQFLIDTSTRVLTFKSTLGISSEIPFEDIESIVTCLGKSLSYSACWFFFDIKGKRKYLRIQQVVNQGKVHDSQIELFAPVSKSLADELGCEERIVEGASVWQMSFF